MRPPRDVRSFHGTCGLFTGRVVFSQDVRSFHGTCSLFTWRAREVPELVREDDSVAIIVREDEVRDVYADVRGDVGAG